MPVTTVDSTTIPSGVAPTPSTTYFTTVTEAMYAWGNSMPEYIFAKYPGNVHLYIPGANGVAINTFPTNNYTLSDGSTGYSAVDGTAGLVLDGAGSVGADEKTYSVGATWSQAGNTFTSITTDFGSYLGIGGSANKTYRVDVTVSGGVLTQLANVTGAPLTLAQGANVVYVYATASPVRVQAAIGAVVTINSVKEVTGIHATQPTTANKPALRRGLYNQILQSNAFNNAQWTLGSNAVGGSAVPVVTPNYTTAPDGTNTASRIVFTPGSGGGYSSITNVLDATAGLVRTNAIFIKSNTTAGNFQFGDSSIGYATIAVTTSWQLFVYNASTGGRRLTLIANPAVATVSDLSVFQGAIFAGTLTAAQILSEGGIPLTTSTAASNSGAGRYSWQFDGTNDSLALGSVPFQMSDDHCVIVGMRHTATGVQQSLVTCSSTSSPTPLICDLEVAAANNAQAYWRDDAGASSPITGAALVSGSVNVLSGRKVGNAKILRVNGSLQSTDNNILGTTTVNTSNIGALVRTSTQYYNSGSIGPVILIKGTVSDADLLTLERWVAANTPSGPVF